MDDFDDRVKQRAYRLWVEEGCPEGRSEVHWDKARELVAVEENQRLVTKPALRGERGMGEPVEPAASIRNAGEFPTLRDQGGQATAKRPTVAAARAPSKRKASEPKPPKDGGTKRR
jgi:hypothetical protein